MDGMRMFNVFDAEMTFDPADPKGYRAGSHRFGPKIGASRLGATVYELPPGEALCPYHYESEEEWLLVLQGQVTLRHPEGDDVLGPGDITPFPVGPAGAAKTTPHSGAPPPPAPRSGRRARKRRPTTATRPCAWSCSRRPTRSATASTPTRTRSPSGATPATSATTPSACAVARRCRTTTARPESRGTPTRARRP